MGLEENPSAGGRLLDSQSTEGLSHFIEVLKMTKKYVVISKNKTTEPLNSQISYHDSRIEN